MLLLGIFLFYTYTTGNVEKYEEKIVQCIKTIALNHFPPFDTVVLSIYDNLDHNNLLSIGQALAQEIHLTEQWSIILSGPSDTNSNLMIEPEYEKHDNYIIIAYGEDEDDVYYDMVDKVEFLKQSSTWNARSRFVVLVILGSYDYNSSDIAKRLLEELWFGKILNVIVVIKQTVNAQAEAEKRLDVYTWFPYQDSDRCLTIDEVVVIDSWLTEGNGYFQTNSNLFPEKINSNLHQCPVIAATFPIDFVVGPPIILSESELTYDGIEVQLIKFVVEALNLTMKFRPPPPNNGKWGTLLPNSTVTGLLSEVVLEKADIGFGAWPLHPELLTAMDATISYYRDDWLWWVPCAKKIPRWKGIALVFQTDAWVSVFLSIALSVVVMILLTKNVQNEYIPYGNLSCFHNMWSVILGLSVVELPRTNPVRIFFTFWVWYCLSINTIFQAFLTTFLIDPGFQHQWTGIEEVVNHNIKYGYNPGFDRILKDSPEEFTKEILRNRLECREYNNPPCLDWMAYHDNFSLLCSETLVRYILTNNYFDEDGKSLICRTPGLFFPLNYVTYMTKWNPLLNQFSDKLTMLIENGMRDQWLEGELHLQQIQAAQIRRKNVAGDYFDLSLEHCQGVFAVLVPGLVFSVLAFIGEFLNYKLTQHCRAKPKHISINIKNQRISRRVRLTTHRVVTELKGGASQREFAP
ncbi:Ionotropic receptor 200 [Blattella germanica]|nr:Ionotropic receptor 200 [Blattella germanica]